MHFDRILLNVDLYDVVSLFFSFFTVSVNVLCFHGTYGRDSKRAYRCLLLANTCYDSMNNDKFCLKIIISGV